MLVLRDERMRALTKRGVDAYPTAENLCGLRSELLELALAIDEILTKGATGDELRKLLEAAALEGADVVIMLARLRAEFRRLLGDLEGVQLWDHAEGLKLTKAEAKVSEKEAANAAEVAQ
jgi:hypothetical protein